MEVSKTSGEQIKAATQLEKADKLSEAAAIYQKLFNNDGGNQLVIGRLLILYRKLKDYKMELAVLNDAIAAYHGQQKAVREKWIQAHPKAASAGRSMLRLLEKEGNGAMSQGEDSAVSRWIKRKEVVTGRLTGKKGKAATKPAKGKKATAEQKKPQSSQRRQAEAQEKERRRQEEAAAKKKAAQDRREAAARQKREASERKAAEASRRKAKQEQKKAAAVRQKAEARRKKDEASRKAVASRKKTEAHRPPSLFVAILRYLVSTEEIDAAMKQHMAYLNKHYESGEFLLSGRQVPRTGGIILMRGKDRKAVEKIIEQDPFLKRRLASAEIIEFTASQFGKGLEEWLNPLI